MRPALKVEDLERWAENGATWRAVRVSDQRVVVDLCTCYGEPVDRLEGDAPDVVEYVRARGDSFGED
jgi:hypothetical protein